MSSPVPFSCDNPRGSRLQPPAPQVCIIRGSGCPVPVAHPCDSWGGRAARVRLPRLTFWAGRLAGPLTSKATAAIKLISFLIYTRLSSGELWTDLIKVCKWCAYAINFNPLMPFCQNKILKKGFEGDHMGIMALQKRALSTR